MSCDPILRDERLRERSDAALRLFQERVALSEAKNWLAPRRNGPK